MNKKSLSLLAVSIFLLGACTNRGITESDHSEPAPEHVHALVFKSFIWQENPGNYTAQARYICQADGYQELYDSTIEKTVVEPAKETDGKITWKATYDGHEDTKIEVLESVDHDWEEPTWTWNHNCTKATAHFVCKEDASHIHEEVATIENGDITYKHLVEADHYDDGVDRYYASVVLNSIKYTSPAHDIVKKKGTHVYNEFGACDVDGDFAYKDNRIDYDWDWFHNYREFKCDVNIGDQLVNPGDFVCYSYSMFAKGHEIEITDLNGLTMDEFRFGVLRDTEEFEEITDLSDLVYLDTGITYSLYIRIDAQTAKTNPSFTVRENHHLGYVHYCSYCDLYYGSTFSHYSPISFSFTEGERMYFRFQAWPGAKYYVFFQNDLAGHEDEFEIYYLGENFIAYEYDLNDPFPEESPFTDDQYGHSVYVYMVFNPTTSGHGYLAVDQL